MKSVFSVLVLGLWATGALASDFVGSCDANTLKVSGKILTGNCKNIFGQLKCSKLDLNRCLKNNYGRLQEDPLGAGPHFGDQCVNCTNTKPTGGLVVDAGPTVIYCKCNPGTGATQADWPTAVFDINLVVDNNNGVLECYSNKGAAC